MTVMTQAEELAELRRWIREDFGKLNDKIDDYIKDNNKSHVCFQKQLSTNTAKLGIFAGGIALVVAGVASFGFQVLGGQ